VEERAKVRHHLIEFLSFEDSFTVAHYIQAAKKAIADIHSRGKIPIVVGGTGLYINSLVDNIIFADFKTDFELRKKLEDEMETVGADAMLSRLYEIDPETAQKLHSNDRRRIIRAFEIYYGCGMTKHQQDVLSKSEESPYDAVMIGINYRDREKLYERINKRVEKMIEEGLLSEAKAAYNRNIKHTSGAVQAIGHKELFKYFMGEKSLEECIENLKRSSRRYAKRQITWFSKDPRINWIYPDECDDISAQALEFIQKGVNGR
ncbi:MAG: tRNA (adenosine(37)-N6)-dimethylallyltransferase MiaA, partial [Clostridia bacterium]|nr:tRNA (adenosine(37)-N6)-dimethylallyltransferase MiaA [Clostridia bacterium]